MVQFLAASTVPFYIDGEKSAKRAEGEPTGSELSKTTRIVHVITHLLLMPFALIYSIFVPLKLGTWWFLAGLPFCALALVLLLGFAVSWATAPLGEPMTKGIYAISRHPACLGMFLGFIGIGITCASWVFLLCALVHIVSWHFGVVEEERVLVDMYGEAYREYMARTPRWIGLPRKV
jgi:protein-S-isoprenylcysteine O-methyltransferase Ste14